MKKHQFNKFGLVVCVASLAASISATAADLAGASGVLADIAVMATQANTALAAAANGGNVDAITEAQKRADAVDSAMAEAQEAYAAMERAVAGGDEDAAAAAADDLEIARQKAYDALNGAVPEESPKSKHDQWKEGQKNTGGGPGRAYDPPNIYDRPWDSRGLRDFYQGLFGDYWASSAHGSSRFGEIDATPE